MDYPVCREGLPIRKKDVDILEQVQWRAAKMLEGLENVISEERLTEWGLFSVKMSEFRSCCCLKLPNGHMQRRWSQALLTKVCFDMTGGHSHKFNGRKI